MEIVTRPARELLVEQYLKSRKLELPDAAAGEAIRFHSRCKFDSEWHTAMVCLVRNIITNEPQAIHRTALAPDGTAIKRDGKTLRMSLAPITGGAIKLVMAKRLADDDLGKRDPELDKILDRLAEIQRAFRHAQGTLL